MVDLSVSVKACKTACEKQFNHQAKKKNQCGRPARCSGASSTPHDKRINLPLPARRPASKGKQAKLQKKKKLIQEDHRLRCARWVVLSFRQTNQTCSSDWRNLGIALHFSKAPSKRAAVLNVCSSNLNVVVLFTPSWEKFQQFHMRKLDNRFLGFDVKTRLNNSQSNLFF